ncbi:MAG: succinylglutamate desuccinylase/aspartoacylase family protein [Faecalibacterium sp.]
MKQEVLYTLETPYRQKFEIEGFRFGSGENACAIVAGVRGNEVQQMYVCACLVKRLRRLEEQGAIAPGCELLVVPCVNHFSMNVGSRFWAMDKTDINRMFPGYDQGETTQRIADALFKAVQGYKYGIHFASFYLPGDFVPHVRIMNTGYQTSSLGNLFGLPFVVMREPQPIDTTTLNYNWQIWETNAFSIYTKETDQIDEESARQAVAAVLRYLSRVGVLRYHCHSGFLSTVVQENEMTNVLTPTGGIFRRLCAPGDEVEYGQKLGEILDPFTAEIRREIFCPTSGVLFFAMKKPLATEHEVAFKVIRRLHS